MWAAGLSAQEMADFSLGCRLGAAIERTFDERFGSLTAGELGIPIAPIFYDAELDLNPVIATPDGALVVDARVRLQAPAPAFPSLDA